MASEPLIVQAVYSFKGTNNDELCFKKGDIITVTQKEEGGWWEGTLGEKTGWFPSNYVRECKDVVSPAVSPVRAPAEIAQQRQYRAVVLKDLIDSEKAHITELQGLVTNFLQPLEKSDILARDEYRQLTGNLSEVVDTHVQLLNLIEENVGRSPNEQRVGKLFLQWAPRIKAVHQAYCSLHPKAVCILDKYKDELTTFMESAGAASPGLLVLTAGLSKPFRRLDKYAGMLQELERHVEESHPDRGDTQRSVAVYKDIASVCSATRRQKELELQVLTGPVRGWEGQSLAQLGDILHMGSVAVGPKHSDRYLVLFPSTLLMLSVSHRMSAFIYEGKLPLTGISVKKLEDNDTYKNAFEIAGPLIEPIVAVCQSKEEAQAWVDLLRKHTQSRGTVSKTVETTSVAPQPPPHLDARGYSTRASVLNFEYTPPCPYRVTLPPSTHPSASPYTHLNKFFSRLVRHKVITRKLLKKLLYSVYFDKIDLRSVPMRRHKSEFVMVKASSNNWQKASVIIVSSDESSSDNSDSESSSCDSSSSCSSDSEDEPIKHLSRQDAVDKCDSPDGHLSTCSSNPFGFIRYFNPDSEAIINYKTESVNIIQPVITSPNVSVTTEYNSESFIDHGEDIIQPAISDTLIRDRSIVHTSTARVNLAVINQHSENSDNSSFDCRSSKPFMACEDLVNLDGTIEISPMEPLSTIHKSKCIPQNRQSCPTKLVANKFNKCSLTTISVPIYQTSSDYNLTSNDRDSVASTCSSTMTHSSSIDLPVNPLPCPDGLVAELLYNWKPLEDSDLCIAIDDNPDQPITDSRKLTRSFNDERENSNRSSKVFSNNNSKFLSNLTLDDTDFNRLSINNRSLNRISNDNADNYLKLNLVHQPESASSERSEDTVQTAIQPPLMFRNKGFHPAGTSSCRDSTNEGSVSTDRVTFQKPFDMKRRSSVQENRLTFTLPKENIEDVNALRRCVSYHFIEVGSSADNRQCSNAPYCKCCVEPSHSPRSSDSGMAGSCTLASPDYPSHDPMCNCRILSETTSDDTRCGIYNLATARADHCNFVQPKTSRNTFHASQMEPADFEAQCRCTSPFGSTPRTSCQPFSSISETILVESTDSTTSVTSSDLTPFSTPQPWESENQIHQKLRELTESVKRCRQPVSRCDRRPVETVSAPTHEVFRSGLYAHWWLKKKIPTSVVRGIVESSQSHENETPSAGKDSQHNGLSKAILLFAVCIALCCNSDH